MPRNKKLKTTDKYFTRSSQIANNKTNENINPPVILPMHYKISSNPELSIIQCSSPPKQPPKASTSDLCDGTTEPVSCEPDITFLNNEETQKHSKRSIPNPIYNRKIKKPRLSVNKPTNAIKNNKIPSVQSKNEKLQPSDSELNCKDNCSHLNIDKKENGFHRKYCLYNNEYLLHHLNIDNDDTTEKTQEMVELRIANEKFWFKQSLSNDILQIVRLMIQNKTSDDKEFESIIKSSTCLQLPKVDCSTSTNSNKSPASKNNIYSINQPNQVGIEKSQKQTIIQQQPSKQTIKSSKITKQRSTSTNKSSKMQLSTINQTDSKHHASNNQHNNTPLKYTRSTATRIQASNEQIANSHQLPISITKKEVNINQNVKPAIIHQPSVNDVNKCIKCKALSKDQICAICQMLSRLKNVAVIKIGTPSTSAVVPKSPTITSTKPIDVLSSSINSVSCEEPQVVLLSSEDEDEESLEPIITKMETKEALKKHTDKLCLNPKLLEDKLWQKDFAVKDYYKIEECHSVHIGSFKTVPAPSGDMVVFLHGIRMTVKGLEPEPVTIDLQMDNIVKILGYYGENPLIIIYTNHLAAAGIQYLLNMNEDNKNHFYDPFSKDITLNKIVWFFNLKKSKIQHLKKLLLKLFKTKYAPLTSNQVNKILCSKKQDEEENEL